MKKIRNGFILFTLLFLLASCRDNTLSFLCKKWDCIKIDNLDPIPTIYQSQQDSIAAITLAAALKTLTWTFKENKEYRCEAAGKLTADGTYQVTDHGNTLLCTPHSKSGIYNYHIDSLSADDLVLSSLTNNVKLIMHFKPH